MLSFFIWLVGWLGLNLAHLKSLWEVVLIGATGRVARLDLTDGSV